MPEKKKEKSRIRETPNLSTVADRSTNTERSIQGHSAVQCSVVQCSALFCTSLHFTALHCTALHCTALCPCMLLSVLVLLSESVERFGVSHMRDFFYFFIFCCYHYKICSAVQCCAALCSTVQCGAV